MREELAINEETKIIEMLEFMDITLEDFYYDFVAEGVNRAMFWRSINDESIVISRK